MHEDFSRRHQVKVSSERSFGFVMAAAFALVATAPMIRHGQPRVWAFVVAAIMATMALVRPSVLRPLNIAWAKFGLLLNRVTSPIILGVVFYLAVVPTGLLMRVFKNDPLRRKRDPAAASYWVPRASDRGSMTRQF